MSDQKLRTQVAARLSKHLISSREKIAQLPMFWLVVLTIGIEAEKFYLEYPELFKAIKDTPFEEDYRQNYRTWSILAKISIKRENPQLYRETKSRLIGFCVQPIAFEITKAIHVSGKCECRVEFGISCCDSRFWPQALYLTQYNTRDEKFYDSIAEGGEEWWDLLTRNLQPLSFADVNKISNTKRALAKRKKGSTVKDILVDHWLSHVLWNKSYADILECLNDKLNSGNSMQDYERDIDKIKTAIRRLPLIHRPSSK